MRRSFWAIAAGVCLSNFFLFPSVTRAQSPITCSNPAPATDVIRQEGKTEQIGDFFFTCNNPSGISPVTMTVAAIVSAGVNSEVLDTGSGATEATLLVTNSDSSVIGQAQGTISGIPHNVVTFVLSNFAMPTGVSTFDITNIRVDATQNGVVVQNVTVSGSSITTATFSGQTMATVVNGITSSIANVANYGAGAAVTASTPAFQLKFGEGATLPTAFKIQGTSSNNTEGSWLTNNTETGYFVTVVNSTNIATSGTRIRMIFNNVPTGMNLYVPIFIGTDQTVPTNLGPTSIGSALLTTSEAGAFSQASAAAPQPAGYSGTSLALLTVSGGSAEAVYEIQSDSLTTVESYTVPVYVTGTVPANAGNMTAAVSFAPVAAASNIPYFAQLASSTSTLNASQFSLNATSTSPLPTGEVGASYNQTLLTGGTPPYSANLTAGASQLTGLGLSFNATTGVISGNPNAAGNASITVAATDSVGASVTSPSLSLTVNSAISIATASLPTGAVNDSYSTTLAANNGVPPYTWSVTSGSLPPGFSPINTAGSGVISGTPTTAGSYSFTVTVTDSLGAAASLAFNGTSAPKLVINPALAISTNSIPAGEIGIVYSTPISATGGVLPLTYQLVSNTSPLIIDGNSGVLSSDGSALNSGNNTSFKVQVRDAAGGVVTSNSFTLVVDSSIQITTSALSPASVGESWASTVAVSGGAAITNWSGTNLPAWLSLSQQGVLSGTPPATGAFPFSVKATDSAGGTSTANLNLAVTMPMTYLVVNSSNGGGVNTASLQQVSGDGTVVSTLASGAAMNATDMVLDGYGNAILATGTSLIRVVPLAGLLSTVAAAPNGSQWAAVAVDKAGNFIVGDNKTHAVWRVSSDGRTLVSVANYPVRSQALNEHVKVAVLPNGNYFVASDNVAADSPISLFTITPAGAVTQLSLSGTPAYGVGGMTPDGNGGYMLLDTGSNQLVDFTAAGVGTSLASVNNTGAPLGVARNPLTGDFIVGFQGGLTKVNSTGSSVTQFATSPASTTNLGYPLAVAALPLDFPATVDSTSPLAYFRLETAAGTSEGNGTYSYAYSGGGSVSNLSQPPIGVPANNYALLDGSSGEITTSLSGGIATAGSMMAWVNLAVLPSNGSNTFNYIAGESTIGNDFDLQFLNTNVLGFFTTCCATSLNYTPDPTTLVNRWHMIVVTYDANANSRSIYWDGAQVATDLCSGCSSYENKPGAFWIGNSSVFNPRFFNGSIDDVAVWNYSLSPAQVYQMYASRPPASTGVVTGISPVIAPVNASPQLTVNGQGFNTSCGTPCNALWFVAPDGSVTTVTPTTTTATQIVATVPANALQVAGVANVSVTNSSGVPANALPLTILAPLAISPVNNTLPDGTVSQLYTQPFTASGGSGNYSWSVPANNANLSMSSPTGASVNLTGTPNSVSTDGPFSVTVQLTDTTTNATTSTTYQITVDAQSGPPAGQQPSNTNLYVLSEDGSIYSVTNGMSTQIVGPTGCEGCYESDIVRDGSGNLIVAEGDDVTAFTPAGATVPGYPLTVAALGGGYFQSIALDPSGNLLIADSSQGDLIKITGTAHQTLGSFAGNGDAYVRVDSQGNYIVITDTFSGDSGPTGVTINKINPDGLVNSIAVTAAPSTSAPRSIGGFTFDASGNYVITDWYQDAIYTVTPSGTSTPLFSDPNLYFSDLLGIARDRVGGSYFFVDDRVNTLNSLSANGSTVNQISNSVGTPAAVFVADTVRAAPLTFTPAPGTLTPGYTGVPYTLPLVASGGSGNYSWQIVNRSFGLNLVPSSPTGASISLTGTPTQSNTDAGPTITVQLTDTVTLLTVQQTYTIPVNASALWTAAGTFDDGGTLSGSFNYGSGAVSLWNVTTSSGRTLTSPFTFTPSNSTAHYFSEGSGSCTGICIVFTSNQQFPAANGSQPRILALSFNDLLDNNFGGAVSLETDHSNGSSGSYECLQCSPIRYLTIGSVSSGIPVAPQLPGTVAYLLEENGEVDASAGAQVTQLAPGSDSFCCLDFAVDSSGNFIIAGARSIFGIAPNGAPLSNFSPTIPETAFIGSIAIDSSGNYIVADEGTGQILRYVPPTLTNPSPQPTVVAQNLVSYGIEGDVLVRVDSSGNYIVLGDDSDTGDGPTQVIALSITPAGAVTQIPLTVPGGVQAPISACGMTLDANGNYVGVDCYGEEIYTIAKAGAGNQGTVSVLYGNPDGYLSDPLGITRDPRTGNFFLTDDENDALYTFAPDGSNFSQVLSGGLLNNFPSAVFVADTTPPTTVDYALQNNGTLMATVGGATLSCGVNCDSGARDLAVDASGNFIIAAISNLVKLTPAGVSTVISGSATNQWVSVAVDGSGNYIVVDNALHQIQVISPAGTLTNTIPYTVVAPDVFEDAYVRIDSAGNYIVAEDNGGEARVLNQIYRITPTGVVTTLTITASPISIVSGLTFDANGHYVVSDSGTDAIYVLTPGAGNTLTASVLSNSAALDVPVGVSRDPVNGNFLVGTAQPDGLASLNAAGTQVTILLNNVANPVGTAAVTFGIGTTSLTAGTQGQSYAPVNLAGIGGSGSYTWSATGLPAGMSLSANGILSGTPTASGTFQVRITLTDTDGHSTVTALSLSITGTTVAPPPPPVTPPLTITTGALPDGTVGVSYFASVSASGGSGSYSWSMAGAPGLSISSAGQISGTPTTPGTFTVSVSVSAAGLFALQSYTIAIAPAPLTISGPNNLGGFAPSGAVSASYTASGGQSPYKWSAKNLPAGLTLSASTGALTGAIASPGNYSFTVQVADSQSLTTSLGVSMYVLGIGTSKLPDGTNHIAYSQSLSAIGGPGPYTWASSGSLPPGLSLAPSGVISGTPTLAASVTTPQNYTFGVSLAEGTVTVSGNVSITVTLVPEQLSVSGGGLQDASLNVGYSQALTAAGGVPPYTWSVLAGSMPPGMGLNSSGTFAGTPTSIGSFGFTAQVKDTSGGTAAAGFTINVDPPSLTITTGSPLPNAIAGSAYPTQSFAATGGIGPYTFAVTSGSLPAGLSMSDGTITGTPSAVGSSSFTITASDSSSPAVTTTAEYQISVAQPHTDLVLSSTSLSFSLFAGATTIPASDVVTVGSSGTQNLGYTLAVTPAASWLNVRGGGTTPDNITIALDPSAGALPAGPVKTSIVVTCVTPPGSAIAVPCAGNAQTISVSLNVVNAPPLLSVGPGLLSFSGLTASPGTTTQSLIVQNSGGGKITVNSITSPDTFVSVGTTPASIGPGASASVAINVNTTGVAAGYYQSSLLVNTSAGSATIPLTLLVASNPTLVLAPSGAQFQMIAGSSPGNPNGSFTVDVNSTSTVNWHAAVLPGANWLTISTTSISSTSAAPGKVIYTINSAAASALAVGTYYGTIEVSSGGIVNSPQDYLVVLNVNAAPDLLQPDPEPAGLLFVTNGTSSVPAQTVNLYSGSTSPLAFLASVSSSAKWLSVTVSGSGTAGVGAPGASLVSVNTVGMSAGVYTGNVSYQFIGSGSSAGVRSVNVTLIIQKSGTIPSDRNGNAEPGVLRPQQQTSTCAPSQLVPTQTGLVNAFSQPASWPTPLNILLTDDCGNPQPNGQVVVTFSNGDAPLELSPVDTTSGNFSATWTPRNAANQITIAAQGTASGFAPAVAQITGAVTPKATPLLTPNGTLNVFAPVVGAPIAPGTIIQIYGSNLSGQPSTATNIPLPTKLNSTQVLIGGHLAPLYYVSSGQINAQVPFELNAGQTYQLIVNANGALSTPNRIQLSTVAPGVAQFTDGQVIAQHLDGSLITETSPAAPNEIIVFYVAGMGQTSQNVSTGDASATANNALDPPTLTVAGIPVTNILYAGLTPTLVGLYQVDFQVPATTPAGDQQMVLTQSGQGGQSNTTVLPVGAAPQQ